MDQTKKSSVKLWMKNHSTEVAGYGGLLFCIIFFSIMTPIFGKSIWSLSKIKTLMSDVIVLAIMSVGAIFVYALGNMDISIGKQLGLYATLIVILGNKTGSLLPGIIVSVAIAVVIGTINGATGEILKIHPIITSLVFMMVLSGVSSIMYTKLGTRNVSLRTIDTHIFKNPMVMFVVLLIEILLIFFLFNYTKFGKNAKAIGANQIAAQQSGIHLLKYKVIAYIIMGFSVVCAALFQMGHTGSSSDSTGTGVEMNVMVALILGGMPLNGGMKSRVSCAVVGALTYSILDVGLPMIGVRANQVYLIKAIIFIVVVLITCRKRKGVLPR